MRRAKIFLATLGFLLALAGIALDSRPLIWAAMAVLAAALGFRLWLRRQEPRASTGTPGGE